MSDLKEDWVKKKLGDICSIKTGNKNANQGSESGKYPFFTCAKEIYKIDHFDFEGEAVLVAGNGFFNVKYYKGKFDAYQRTYVLMNFSEYGRYIYRYIESKLDDITADKRGSTIPYIRISNLTDYMIELPSTIEEQKHIVEVLESYLDKLNSARKKLEKIPLILKRFRKSVLANACNGNLTADWSEGKDLVEWEEKKLIDVIIGKPKNGYSPQGVAYETPYKNLTLTATTSGRFIEGRFKFVDININEKPYLWVKRNDILIQRSNSLEYVGTSAIYLGEDDRYVYPDLMMKITVNTKIVIPKFINYALSTLDTKLYFVRNATGTAGNMPKINQTTVSNTPIPVPSLPEQEEIVSRVDALFALADKIELQYKSAKIKLERAERAIYEKAFKGDL